MTNQPLFLLLLLFFSLSTTEFPISSTFPSPHSPLIPSDLKKVLAAILNVQGGYAFLKATRMQNLKGISGI